MDQISETPCLIGETIVFRDEGFVWLFSQTFRKVVRARSLNKKIMSDLKEMGFFGPIPDLMQKFDNLNLMLLLGNKCHLRCLYCYAETGSRESVLMSKDTAKTAMDSYLKLKPMNPRVTLFAFGEPTLNFPVIKYLLENYGDTTRWSLTTSGVTRKEVLRFLKSHNVKVTFSVDGPAEIQDWLRPMKGGQPTSGFVEDSIRFWKESNPTPLTVRTTITHSTVHRLSDILEYFAGLGVDQVHLEPISLVGRGSLCENEVLHPQQWSDAVIYALDWARSRHKVILIGELAHFFGSKTLSYCGPINGTSIVVTHNGLLTACSEVADEENKEWPIFHIGKVDRGFRIEDEKRRNLERRIGIVPVCRQCFARLICKGGCAHKAISQTGSINTPMDAHCEFMRLTIPRLIKRMVLNSE